MACHNWPGTFQCVDATLMSGTFTGDWFMMQAQERQFYKGSILKCINHRIPVLNPRRKYHSIVFVNDYLHICGGYNMVNGADLTLCQKFNLITWQYEAMASMLNPRRHANMHYVEDKIYTICKLHCIR
jgi:hypothetical protein